MLARLRHGLPEILAVTHLDNYPSQAVARRIGMTDQGVVEKWYDGPSQLFRTRRAGSPEASSVDHPETVPGSVRGEASSLPDVPRPRSRRGSRP